MPMRNRLILIALLVLPHLGLAKDPKPISRADGVCLSIATFNQAAGSPPLVIGFDDLPCGSLLDGTSLCGVTFHMINAPLEVVCAEETFTPGGFQSAEHPEQHSLRATSGQMLLSPGGVVLAPGPNPAVEDDDIVMTFNPPVACIGFDHISQHADGMSYTQVTVIADDGQVLHRGTLEIGSGRWLMEHGEQRFIDAPAPPILDGPDHTADFWGFVSSKRNIRELRIDEGDDNDVCPDANIGVDSLRFAPFPSPCGSADITGDGRVDSSDVQMLMLRFGPADPVKDGRVEWSAMDLNRDGAIDSADLVEMLTHAR